MSCIGIVAQKGKQNVDFGSYLSSNLPLPISNFLLRDHPLTQPLHVLNILHTTLFSASTHHTRHSLRMLSSLLVLNEYLPFLAIPPRLLFRDAHDVEDGCRLAKDGVHLLKGTVRRLGVEKVNDWEDEGVAGVKIRMIS